MKPMITFLYILFCFSLASLLMAGTVSAAVMSSTNYSIAADSINVGGTENSAGTNYKVSDTAGEHATGDSTGILYLLKAGYRQLVSAITSSSGSSGGSTGTTPGSGPPGGTYAEQILISNISVVKSDTFVLVSWQTNQPSISLVEWGLTTSYETGLLQKSELETNHVFKISGLNPNTHYIFKVTVENRNRVKASVGNQEFVTLALPDTEPPSNVGDPKIDLFPPESVNISWANPTDHDFDSVIVVRGDDFYPATPTDGVIVYHGRGESYTDPFLKEEKLYYYTIFSKDISGNYSSGVIFTVRLRKKTETGEILPPEIQKAPVIGEEAKRGEIGALLKGLSLLDIRIVQNGKTIFFEDDTIHLDGALRFKIKIPYEKLPEVLKTIAVTIADADDPSKVFSFLLRVNKEKTVYEATIGELGHSGRYAISFAVLDHVHRGVRELQGALVVEVSKIDLRAFQKGVLDFVGKNRGLSVAASLLFIVVITRLFIKRKLV